jgi:ABC-2 type transport system permease protein
MAEHQSTRWYTLLQREIREYRTSMVMTPLVTAILLALVMGLSVLFVNRISIVGEAVVNALVEEGSPSMDITVRIDKDRGEAVEYRIEKEATEQVDGSVAYTIETQKDVVESEWNFSRDWTFTPSQQKDRDDTEGHDGIENFNPVLNALHALLLLILFIVSANYLLGTLYDDRKDRSILFWRSMPVSEWEAVLSKFFLALLVAPAIFIAISIVLQIVYVLLSMLLVWRMDLDPFATILERVEFGDLLFGQIGGWLLTALLIAPTYAYLLLASAFAKRSPFLTAIAPVIGLLVVEQLFFGTSIIDTAIGNHMPHFIADGASHSTHDAVGFYIFGPNWSAVDPLSVAGGLAFTVLALTGAVWLRRHRWEI